MENPDAPPLKVAMFCTGGIRCEKSTAFLKAEGVEQVFHLKGGVLDYLEQVPEPESLWRGECFVFDERVAVGHGLSAGTHVLCRGCRAPVSPELCRAAAVHAGRPGHHFRLGGTPGGQPEKPRGGPVMRLPLRPL